MVFPVSDIPLNITAIKKKAKPSDSPGKEKLLLWIQKIEIFMDDFFDMEDVLVEFALFEDLQMNKARH